MASIDTGLNFDILTPERVSRAAALVQDGVSIPCGRRLETEPAVDNPNPALHDELG